VTDFPVFEKMPDGRLAPAHHPFTAPVDITEMEESPETAISKAYDLVLNGAELGSGSVRIHDSDTQRRVFTVLGISDEEAEQRFGWFLRALRYGTPPHAGFAVGIDRLVSILQDEPNIREVIPFPKTQTGTDPLTESPTPVGDDQLRELGLDLRPEVRAALEEDERRTVLFLDEIHRFTKAQQDALLPGVETGIVILVGATTENPFFEVNSPLISRSSLFRLEALSPEAVAVLIDRAMTDADRGLGGSGLRLDPEAAAVLATRTGGDARLAYNALELAALITEGRGDDTIDPPTVEEALQRRIIRYDKKGDQHYDVISAFIKSIRGSDPDAAAYWLQLMIDAGEDPEFIARRMVILASEDIGLADSGALSVAVDAARALAYVGLPEASYALHHAALYLAAAPKSNSVLQTIGAARRALEETPEAVVPPHLRSGGYPGAAALGHGEGYRYPHDHPGGLVSQQYLPDAAAGRILYRPGAEGDEAEMAKRLIEIDRRLGRPPRGE
jgi:putative ATPase